MAKKGNRVQVILECTEHKATGKPGTSRYVTTKNKKNTVFLMAGGKGTRLMPLTRQTPKPLLKIKGTPIIEKIILFLQLVVL